MELLSLLLSQLGMSNQQPVIRSPQMEIAEPQYEDKVAEALTKLQDATGLQVDSPEARQLLRMTKAVESENGKYLRQLSGGPGVGAFQIEPKTEQDIWDNFLEFHPKTREYVSGMNRDLNDELYGATMARLKYYRQPGKIPKKPEHMAQYWADNYNTKAGSKGRKRAVELYDKYYGGAR